MAKVIDFWTLSSLAQEYLTSKYAQAFADPDNAPEIYPYIEQYLKQEQYIVEGLTTAEVVKKLYDEMTGASILTEYLTSEVEEINVNSWDDVAITTSDGKITKLPEHFKNERHASVVIKRLLGNSGATVNELTPIAQGHLPNNARICAVIDPIVDDDVGVAASIRLLHPQKITRKQLVESNSTTAEMMDFMTVCLRYGVSMVFSGVTSSGKTTEMNAVLREIPNDKRIVSIESGARELSLVRRDDTGNVNTNVVHMLSRPSAESKADVSQEDLVVASLRFNPDILCIGEMRDVEAYSAVEASTTGHTVVSTVHAGAGRNSHIRIALLSQKKYAVDFQTSLMLAAEAFPVVVYVHKLEDGTRKVMDISECEVTASGHCQYHSLYQYKIFENTYDKNGQCHINGQFQKSGGISEHLKAKLIQHGIPRDTLNRFTQPGMNQ